MWTFTGQLATAELKLRDAIKKGSENLVEKYQKLVAVIKGEIRRMQKLIKENRQTLKSDAEVEKASLKKVETSKEELLKQYEAENGNIINTDDFSKLFVDEVYNGANAAAVHKASEILSNEAFQRGLKNDGKHVILMAGGSGVGKSSAIKTLPALKEAQSNAAFTFDGNLSTVETAIRKIRQITDAGKKAAIQFVYREPTDAFENGVIARMRDNVSEMGRIVPVKIAAANHVGAFETAMNLGKAGENIKFIDNSLGRNNAKVVSMDYLTDKVSMPTPKELEKTFTKIVERLKLDGKLSDEEYRQYLSI